MPYPKEKGLIFSFTFMAFILGTTEYVIVGLLSEIAGDFGVTLAAAGILISGFALAYAIGTPLILSVLGHLPKRLLLLTGITLIIVLNMLSAVSTSFAFLMGTRVVTAILCGLSLSLAISVASDYVEKARRGRAISYILGGFTIANVFGVPIGTLVGQHFDWPATFILVSILGAGALLLNWIYIPRDIPIVNVSAKEQFVLLTNYRILLAFFIPAMGTAAIFTVFTYITPIMGKVMQLPSSLFSTVLFAYGLVTIVSNLIGGRIASGDYVGKLRIVFILQAVIFILFGLTAALPVIGLISLILIALTSYILNASTQLYLIDLAYMYVPKAKDFATSLMPVANNLGIAIGSFIGGLMIDISGLRALPWVAAGFTLIALVITAVSHRLDRKQGMQMNASTLMREEELSASGTHMSS
ncbi:MFS transporter [Paenibacillus sp. GYB006]|uniref:MFS transporter n=1 Tax=Paenibacillus sp. GYB006 TaxID=2994394 RepID=UPI002F9675B6